MSEGVLFSRLLEGFIGGSCIQESSTAKNYLHVSLLSRVSKVFKLVNNKIVDHLQKCWKERNSDFQYGFRSS